MSEWATGVSETLRDEVDTTAVAMDGKTLCGSLNQGAHTTQIFEVFDVAGKVITTDALLTQRSFCQNLCDADADYAMPVKANQKSLLNDIQKVFEPLPSAKTISDHTEILKKTHDDLGAHLDTFKITEKGNG